MTNYALDALYWLFAAGAIVLAFVVKWEQAVGLGAMGWVIASLMAGTVALHRHQYRCLNKRFDDALDKWESHLSRP